MEFRVIDEPIVFEGRGLALLVNEGNADAFTDGCLIRDIRGNTHVVLQVTEQEGLTCLYLRDADTDYFERLFRNVMLDATLFMLLEEPV